MQEDINDNSLAEFRKRKREHIVRDGIYSGLLTVLLVLILAGHDYSRYQSMHLSEEELLFKKSEVGVFIMVAISIGFAVTMISSVVLRYISSKIFRRSFLAISYIPFLQY